MHLLRIPSDSRTAREKLQQVHEDVVQDEERGIPFLIRFNQYFDISGMHDTEYQHYLQQLMNGTEHVKMRISAADDFAEEAEKRADSLGRQLVRDEVEELFLAPRRVLGTVPRLPPWLVACQGSQLSSLPLQQNRLQC